MLIDNASKDFHDFFKCDWKLHWSFSTLFKNAFACEYMLDSKYVAEFGAANSILNKILATQYKCFPLYDKFDTSFNLECSYGDLTDFSVYKDYSYDTFVLLEVIEHIPVYKVRSVLEHIHEVLKRSSTKQPRLILSTPTPLKHLGMDLVWPDSHSYEFSYAELKELFAGLFRIERQMGFHNKFIKSTSAIEKAIASSYAVNIGTATQMIFLLYLI